MQSFTQYAPKAVADYASAKAAELKKEGNTENNVLMGQYKNESNEGSASSAKKDDDVIDAEIE